MLLTTIYTFGLPNTMFDCGPYLVNPEIPGVKPNLTTKPAPTVFKHKGPQQFGATLWTFEGPDRQLSTSRLKRRDPPQNEFIFEVGCVCPNRKPQNSSSPHGFPQNHSENVPLKTNTSPKKSNPSQPPGPSPPFLAPSSRRRSHAEGTETSREGAGGLAATSAWGPKL